MESAKDVGKNVEVSIYQESLEVLYSCATSEDDIDEMDITTRNIACNVAKNYIQKLVDKEKPMKPNVQTKVTKDKNGTTYENIPHCPICSTRLFIIGMCCPKSDCRQVIDWSKDEG